MENHNTITGAAFDLISKHNDAMNGAREKVGIFVDVENIIKTFKENILGLKHVYVDFSELRSQLARGRQVICSNAYSAYSPEFGMSECLKRVSNEGFELRLEEQPGHSQKGVDINIALDIVDYARYTPCDTILLVSGDADFIPAVRRVRSLGKKVQVASFESALSERLASVANDVILLDGMNIIDTCRLRGDVLCDGHLYA